MKYKVWKVGVVVLALTASPAMAQENAGDLTYDVHIQNVGCDDDSCCGDRVDCGDACCDPGRGGVLGAIEGFSLASLLGMEDSGIDIGGWSQWGYHDDNDGVFNTNPNNFQLQQQWFYLGKEADGSKGFDVGGRIDMLYGTDASNTQSFGNPPGTWDYQNGWDHGSYGWALPQLYGEVAMGDLSVKVGHFFTLLGYQVVPATGNFFYSIPYTFNFSEAFTHTGVLSTYKLNDKVKLYNGWTLGWDSGFDQVGSGSSYLGGISIDLADSVNLTYISTFGNLGWIGNRGYTHSIVGQVGLTDNISYVFQSDLVSVDNSPNSGGGHYDTFGINQYLFYTFSDRVKGGARMEWWKADGVSLYEMAYGLNINLLKNVLIRPEIRYNWVPSNTLPQVLPVASNTGNSTSFGDYNNQTIFGVDAILTF